ncbi:HypA-like protein [Coccidioides immitis RS]|uniref:HypA-like protein n=3 Tax=Coccidioides immitis TaxID=5501 RepID=J3K8B0_COCIM|nr:HypA-like protein [Coccidioides immitis RS]EAS31040.3 HypA-like protein [Coccidioides immitis RS]KMP03639.1 HypA [Coccidioides immitis RMSCC 2394]KMU83134.1 HypA [Coccidioides immitis H538.4]TPX23899.1 hypothetical protein DIZ76_013242 [Coccidioides immitis]
MRYGFKAGWISTRAFSSVIPQRGNIAFTSPLAHIPLWRLNTCYSLSQNRTMASAKSIQLSVEDSGVFSSNPRADSAKKASQLLQEDMKSHHIFFNDSGFHNHTVHHVLSIFALGASPEDIQSAFDRAAEYQRPARPVNEDIVKKLSNRDEFKALAGTREAYPHFLEFFQREIEARGTEEVVNEYIFAGDEFADDMLARTFGGLVHPFIHLGFALEFKQPALVAQALAQTAVHEPNMKGFFMSAEKQAGGVGQTGKKTLIELQAECRADPRVRDSAHWSDTNKFFDGVLKRAPEEMAKIAGEFTVGPDQIEERVAELINAVVYYTGAAQNPPKKIKFDFFYIHCVNSAIFLPVFLALPWISRHNKQRLLEWKGRMDLLTYVSRGDVEPRINEITDYKPVRSWHEVFTTAFVNKKEDGHAAKLMRTLAYAEKACKRYENKDGFLVKGDMWLKLGNMVADSIQGPERLWVMSTGFPEAWEDIPDRPRL